MALLKLDVGTLLAACLVFVFFSRLSAVEVLTCYECNSAIEDSCSSSDSLTKFVHTCNETAKGCRKIKLHYNPYPTGSVTERIIRQCAMTSRGNGCRKDFGTNGNRIKREVCECSGHNCNRSQLPRPWTLAAYATVSVLLCLVVL